MTKAHTHTHTNYNKTRMAYVSFVVPLCLSRFLHCRGFLLLSPGTNSVPSTNPVPAVTATIPLKPSLTLTGIGTSPGTPEPPPPQLGHFCFKLPEQEPHPLLIALHRVHTQSTYPLPSHR